MAKVGLAGSIEADAEIAVELVPVQLNPAVLEAKSCACDDQTKDKDAEHGYPGLQQHGATVSS